MATVCGGWLAMHDAGVPLTSCISGVAMGMLYAPSLKSNIKQKTGTRKKKTTATKDQPDEPIVLTDILGLEDALGCMDLKIAGNETGITAFQLDIKATGLSFHILEKALEQARRGRIHILEKMKQAIGYDAGKSLNARIPRYLKYISYMFWFIRLIMLL